MIYNDDFVWLHFPKCAGTTIEHIFSEHFGDDESICQDPVNNLPDSNINWHDSVEQRRQADPDFELGDRTVICCFRRLPDWLESRFVFELRRSPDLDHDPETLKRARFLEQNGLLNNADYYAHTYLPRELVEREQLEILRTEHFAEDFRRIFGGFLDLSGIPDEVLEKQHNVTPEKKESPAAEVIDNHQSEIYRSAPYWRELERRFY